MSAERRRVAVVGAGIAGLATAWHLADHADVVLYEADSHFGGHAHTVDLTLDGLTHGVDTGFLVFNHANYPHLVKLFTDLQVDTAASEMSFSVQVPSDDGSRGLEWSGSSLDSVFAQRSNLVKPRFLRMLRDLVRFNRSTTTIAEHNEEGALQQPISDFLAEQGFSAAFRDWYLLPMLGCIWSCPTDQMLRFPVATMIRFCHNHGLIRVSDRPQWHTVRGGSRHYVQRLLARIADKRLNTAVRAVRRVPPATASAGVWVDTDHGSEHFDDVVLAGHSDQSLALLGRQASADETAVLGAIRYHANRALLHTDASVLPQRTKAWAAWRQPRPSLPAGTGASSKSTFPSESRVCSRPCGNCPTACTSAWCDARCAPESAAMPQAPAMPRHADPRVLAVVSLFESLSPADLPALRGVYTADARFKDPFNDVLGLPAIARIFDHMFAQLDGPRFTVRDVVVQGDSLFLTWDFDFRSRASSARAMQIHGASHLRFDMRGQVAMHRDYWDAAEALYEKLPGIGIAMRWLKRRAGGWRLMAGGPVRRGPTDEQPINRSILAFGQRVELEVATFVHQPNVGVNRLAQLGRWRKWPRFADHRHHPGPNLGRRGRAANPHVDDVAAGVDLGVDDRHAIQERRHAALVDAHRVGRVQVLGRVGAVGGVGLGLAGLWCTEQGRRHHRKLRGGRQADHGARRAQQQHNQQAGEAGGMGHGNASVGGWVTAPPRHLSR